jgi:hypothetical protein
VPNCRRRRLRKTPIHLWHAFIVILEAGVVNDVLLVVVIFLIIFVYPK